MVYPIRPVFLLVALGFLSCLTSSAMIARHDERDIRRSPAPWYQSDDHPAHALFKREPSVGDGADFAPVGSAAWAAAFPPGKPNPNKLPKAWVNALNAAIKAGKIPNLPTSTVDSAGFTHYPGLDPTGAKVCSTTYQCMLNNDLWNATDGVFASSFDDGPLPVSSPLLYNFLKKNNVHSTHFFIGTNILENPNVFQMAVNIGDDIAVHTWTHPYMTTLSNLDVLGELGYTVQIIHDSTGGRIPKFWRPPFGDSDNRVTAIAQEVFGLRTVMWNHDTEDFSLTEAGGTTPARVQALFTKWLTGPKHPGLIILEHELSVQSVNAFIRAFPLIKKNGWKFVSLARL